MDDKNKIFEELKQAELKLDKAKKKYELAKEKWEKSKSSEFAINVEFLKQFEKAGFEFSKDRFNDNEDIMEKDVGDGDTIAINIIDEQLNFMLYKDDWELDVQVPITDKSISNPTQTTNWATKILKAKFVVYNLQNEFENKLNNEIDTETNKWNYIEKVSKEIHKNAAIMVKLLQKKWK